MSQKHRQEWVKAVSEYAPRAIETLEKHEAEREQRIQKAMDKVRKQAKKRCQVTNRRQSVYHFKHPSTTTLEMFVGNSERVLQAQVGI